MIHPDIKHLSNFCMQCARSLDEKYVVNQHGQRFCTKMCCETYYEHHADQFKESDDGHPYYSDYTSIRQQFILWIEWRSLLQQKTGAAEYPNANAQCHADDLIEELEGIIWKYWDYILTEGDDGPFALEIYNYTLKLRDIQRQLLMWRPERRLFYGIYCYDGTPDLAANLLEKVSLAEGDAIMQTLNRHSHLYREHFDYIFNTKQQQDALLCLLLPYFNHYELDLIPYSTYLCDGGCGDYLDASDNLYWHSGWLYCESCLDMKDIGEMSLHQLQRILEHYDSHHGELQRLIHDGNGDYDRYKQWIRRACRIHHIDFPDWTES